MKQPSDGDYGHQNSWTYMELGNGAKRPWNFKLSLRYCPPFLILSLVVLGVSCALVFMQFSLVTSLLFLLSSLNIPQLLLTSLLTFQELELLISDIKALDD